MELTYSHPGNKFCAGLANHLDNGQFGVYPVWNNLYQAQIMCVWLPAVHRFSAVAAEAASIH